MTSTIEHHAVGHTINRLKTKGLVDVTYVHLDENGHVDLQHLDQILSTSSKTLVSLMHANNEVANLLPLHRVSEIVKSMVLFFTLILFRPWHIIDLICKNLNRFIFLLVLLINFTVLKVGFLCNKSVQINPLIHGGSQERNMRVVLRMFMVLLGFQSNGCSLKDLNTHQICDGLKSYMIERLNNSM